MIKWSDLAACLGTGDEMPFRLETIPQLRRWCVGEFGIDTNAVRKWEKTGRIPPYARQQLVMTWPEIFHKIEFGEKGARYEPKANQG